MIQNKKSESKAYPALLWQGMRTESILSVSPSLYIILVWDMSTKYEKEEKGVWRMPRLPQAMKDVISCEKLR